MPNENTNFENHEDELPDHFEGIEIDENGNLIESKEENK